MRGRTPSDVKRCEGGRCPARLKHYVYWLAPAKRCAFALSSHNCWSPGFVQAWSPTIKTRGWAVTQRLTFPVKLKLTTSREKKELWRRKSSTCVHHVCRWNLRCQWCSTSKMTSVAHRAPNFARPILTLSFTYWPHLQNLSRLHQSIWNSNKRITAVVAVVPNFNDCIMKTPLKKIIRISRHINKKIIRISRHTNIE